MLFRFFMAAFICCDVASSAMAVDRVLDYELESETWIESGDASDNSGDSVLEANDNDSQIIYDWSNASTVKRKDEIYDLDPSYAYVRWVVEDFGTIDENNGYLTYELKNSTEWDDTDNWADWSGGVSLGQRKGNLASRIWILMGDADWNGDVNSTDFGVIGSHWQDDSDVGWREGDFNGDGVVNVTDMNLQGTRWLKTVFDNDCGTGEDELCEPDVVITDMTGYANNSGIWGLETPHDNGFVAYLNDPSSGESLKIYSMEDSTAANRPHFYVNYTAADPAPLPEPGSIVMLLCGLGLMPLRR